MSWYVLQTRPNLERQVEDGLREFGIECYLPRETYCGRRRGRIDATVRLKRPLMPGYVFVRSQAFAVVRRAFGFVGFLHAAGGEEPMPIPEPEIDRLKRGEELGLYDRTPKVKGKEASKRFKKGAQVRIEDCGPFHGFEGFIAVDTGGKPTARVEIEIFGRPTPVDVDVEGVELVKEAPTAKAA